MLVVEDESMIRAVVEELLASEGYRVVTAGHGRDALEQLQQASAHLILVDMLMPIMDGRAFMQAYQQSPGPHAPIIVMAASDLAGQVTQLGAAAFCLKPFDVEALLGLVSEHLNGPSSRPGG